MSGTVDKHFVMYPCMTVYHPTSLILTFKKYQNMKKKYEVDYIILY